MLRLPANARNFLNALIVVCPGPALATVYEIGPMDADGSCVEEFETLANSLAPGDELVLSGGTYTQSCQRAITVQGTASEPITIRAASGETPLLTRPADNIDTQYNLEIADSHHVVVRGLHFAGGITGVRFFGTNSDIVFEDNRIYGTGNNALAANHGDSMRFILRNNEIYDTGNSTTPSTEGEGMYLGCHTGACRFTDGLVENNYIHDLSANSPGGNDGIEIKVGSGGNIVRGNLIHDTIDGMEYPCIFAYGGGDAPNIIENNTLYACGQAIQVVADAIVRNNVIHSSTIEGITMVAHNQVGEPRNLSVTNNTVYGHPRCLYARLALATNIVIANNAFYCEDTTAINIRGAGSALIANNFVSGALSGIALSHPGIDDGGTADTQFAHVATSDFHLTPGSLLVDAGIDSVPDLAATDIEGTPRPQGAGVDVGAYELNPDDIDADGVSNDSDNCVATANAGQRDTDNDNIGNRCDPDIAAPNDCMVNFLDFQLLKDAFFATPAAAEWNPDADFDGDGIVNFTDVAILEQRFFGAPGPSGLPNACNLQAGY